MFNQASWLFEKSAETFGPNEAYLALTYTSNLNLLKKHERHVGVDIHYQGKNGETGLFHAVKKGSIDTVNWYLSKNAEVNTFVKDRHSFTSPLIEACDSHKLNILNLLIRSGADVGNLPDPDGYRPIHRVIRSTTNIKHGPEILTTLLASGAEINAKITKGPNEGNTALHQLSRARGQGVKIIMALLVDKGADLHAENNKKHTLLDLATKNLNSDAIMALKGLNVKVSQDILLMLEAKKYADYREIDQLDELLKKHNGLAKKIVQHGGLFPSRSLRFGNIKQYLKILEYYPAGIDYVVDSPYGEGTLLMFALYYKNKGAIREIIKFNPDLNITTKKGISALGILKEKGFDNIESFSNDGQ